MKVLLAVNDLLQSTNPSGESSIERVLWVDEVGSTALVIDILAENAFPQHRMVEDILSGLLAGTIQKAGQDPWGKAVLEDELSSKDRAIRDRAWNIIGPLVGPQNEPGIYFSKNRGQVIIKAAQIHEVEPKTVYRYLRRYWQRGKTRNALLPDYSNSGAKGITRIAGEKKRGRPRKYAEDPQVSVGVNVDEGIKRIFRLAISRFYNTSTENPLKTAFDLMLKDFFTEDYIVEGNVRKPVLIPPSQRPTLVQFKYWFEKEQNLKKTITARKGSRTFNLKNRALLGNSTDEVVGPGSKFQIDATVADVYLVSQYNRNWIIGRPVIYVLIDVFSRMITGIYVGLEGPSWLGAMMALANAATDKVAFCKEYGVEISEFDWPCHHMPDAILADRGELESRSVESLISNLNIRIENAAPYRADWKGIVERNFRTIHAKVKPLLPGYVDKARQEPGSRDYRIDAKLDIRGFTKAVICCVLHHNNEHRLGNYERNEMMIADDVPPIPIKLWEWGIQNCSGRLRSFSEEVVKLNLMPTDTAIVTPSGIRFKSMRYSCEKAIKEMWFERARTLKTERVEVSYDPRNMDFIYIKNEGGRSFEKCYLIGSQERYAHKELDEIQYLLEVERLEARRRLPDEQQATVGLIAEIDKIVRESEELTNAVQDNKASKASRVAQIKKNRAFEKGELREVQAFELNKTPPDKNVREAETGTMEEEDLSFPSHLDLLRKKRQEWKNELPE